MRFPILTFYFISSLLLLMLLSFTAYTRNLTLYDEPALWNDIVLKSPRKARGHNMLGNQYKERGMFEEAREQYAISLALEPNAAAHNNLGTVYAALGRNENAIEHYLAALSLNPMLAEAHFNLAVMYLGLGDKDKARTELGMTLRLNPYHGGARQFLAFLDIN